MYKLWGRGGVVAHRLGGDLDTLRSNPAAPLSILPLPMAYVISSLFVSHPCTCLSSSVAVSRQISSGQLWVTASVQLGVVWPRISPEWCPAAAPSLGLVPGWRLTSGRCNRPRTKNEALRSDPAHGDSDKFDVLDNKFTHRNYILLPHFNPIPYPPFHFKLTW